MAIVGCLLLSAFALVLLMLVWLGCGVVFGMVYGLVMDGFGLDSFACCGGWIDLVFV